MNRLEHWFPVLAGIPIGVSVVWMINLYVVPVPIEIFERKLTPEIAGPGDTVTSSWREERKYACSSKIYRQLITSDGIIINFEPINAKEKGPGEFRGSFDFTVPPLATSGEVAYRVRSQFACNWVQRLLGGQWLPLQDLHFEYQPKPGAG